jgi:N utilization substance protein B
VNKPAKLDPARRHKARHYALQALYQWQITRDPINQIEAQFRTQFDFNNTDLEYFQAMFHGVPARLGELEALFTPLLDRALDDLTPIERNLLRMGAWELKERIDVPYRVVINEAVGLAKKFGATDSHKYINGVLDKLAHQLRAVEISAGR